MSTRGPVYVVVLVGFHLLSANAAMAQEGLTCRSTEEDESSWGELTRHVVVMAFAKGYMWGRREDIGVSRIPWADRAQNSDLVAEIDRVCRYRPEWDVFTAAWSAVWRTGRRLDPSWTPLDCSLRRAGPDREGCEDLLDELMDIE